MVVALVCWASGGPKRVQEVQEQIKMATDLSERGDYEQALRILSGLHDAQKISMQETAHPQNVSIDLSTQPDRPPSNLNSVFACA